jgi:spore maturation protein CgeB
VNAPFIAGFSPKLFECYAAGGFMLTSRCADLAEAIGDLADYITFSSAEELRAKVDWYLGRPHERQQIAREIREIIRRDHMAESLLTRTIPMALDTFDSRTNG